MFLKFGAPVALVLLLGFSSTDGLAAPPPAQAFFQEPSISQASLSPDGRRLAMVARTETGVRSLAVLDLATMKPTVAGGSSDRDVLDFRWVNDARLVYRLRQSYITPGRTDGGPGLFGVDANGDNTRQLVESWWAWVTTPEMGVPPLSGRHRLLAAPGHGMNDDVYVNIAGEVSKEKVDYIEVKRLNTRNGRARDIELPLHGNQWLFGHDGEPLAVLTRQQTLSAWQVRQPDGSWKSGPTFDAFLMGGHGLDYQAADGRLFGSASHQGFDAAFEFDPVTVRPKGAPLAAVPGFSVHPVYLGNDKGLLGLRFTVDAEVTLWLDPGMKALQARIDQMLPATSNRISVPHHGDSPWALVKAFADVQPVVTYLFNRQTQRLARVGQALPGIDPKQMGQTDFHRLKARDGLSIPTYLTLPPGGGKSLPLVVLVHGGPWARGSHWAFDPEVQFLASRGYAVLQPEFRGSTGFGRQHLEAGFGQWGLAMQDDLVDAVKWAVAQGHADPKRVCIAGGSYGGYATLMGLARDGDLYRCGIAWVAVSDPQLLMDPKWSDFNAEWRRYGLKRMVGDPAADPEKFKATSPLAQAARIQQPVMLAYGSADWRVPLVHGERMRDALKAHNRQVDWVQYDLEGHGWSKAETRVDFWTRVEKFLAQHIGPKP